MNAIKNAGASGNISYLLDRLAEYVETHTWAGVLLMVLLALAVSTADSWFA